ncbi:MAG: NADH-quinone oxidoreductase subunit M [Actinobacteria bacterium]|nr:NADH-quinone oxidoreductase subunit M [Actinomycetota bacterium]
MLTTAVLAPLAGALALVGLRVGERAARWLAVAVSLVPLAAFLAAWAAFDSRSAEQFQLVTAVEWLPTVGVGYRVGVDGVALAVVGVTTVLFTAVIAFPADTRGRARPWYAWLLFLEGVCLGLFVALDLIVFYVFFDLSLVGMYFLISRWGHAGAEAAALKFFLYTLLGSLALLIGMIGLALAMDPITFDMRELIAAQPLAGAGHAVLVLVALLLGLGIKTPVVPFHTWLPAAHVEAPAPASALLAGVLLKMGAFGMIRIPLAMMRETFAAVAPVLGVVAVVSILYGAFVALGQGDIKRRIAYTSVTHMGYTVLGIAAAGGLLAGAEEARALALTGATIEMVAHGLITGALFLITGSLWERTADYAMDAYGGLADRVPRLTAATVVAAFASLGLPGLVGFVAEFQIFVGAFAVYPVLAAVGLLGVLVTAALFLQLLQRVFLGERSGYWDGLRDLDAAEQGSLGVLLALTVVLGVAPAPLLDVVDAGSTLLLGAAG